jgi:histone-lysine N-methyltransferase SETMAR
MNINKEEIRYVMKFYFMKGKNATQAVKQIGAVYGADAVSDRTVREWFDQFRSGNFDVKDAPRSGRPTCQKVDQIIQKVGEDRH